MLSTLFKPAWQSKSANKRKQFVNAVDTADQDEIDILKIIVLEDEDAEVRNLALHKIQDPKLVFELIKKVKHGDTRDEAVQVFSKLTGPKSKLPEPVFRELIKLHPETTLSIAKTCPFAKLRVEILNNLTLEEQINLLAEIEYSDTRVLIAEKIETIELLEKARHILKGKDKNAEKIVKSKLHQLHSIVKKEEENLEKAETLCDKMEYLAGHDNWRSEFKDRYEQCNREWKSLDFIPSEYLALRYNNASEKVAIVIKRHETKNAANNLQSEVIHTFEAHCAEVAKQNFDEIFKKHDFYTQSLEKENKAWKQSLETVKPEKNTWKHYETLHRSLDSVLNYIEKLKPLRTHYLTQTEKSELDKIQENYNKANVLLANLEWSKDLPKLLVKEQIVSEVNDLKKIENMLKNAANEELDKLHKRINRLQGSTKRGNLGQARRELAALIKLTETYTGRDKTALDERLEKATEAVDKMADWKDYATAPKFIELCEAMEKLSPDALNKANKANMHADKLATKISDLQKSWKALGHSESAELHWERFNKAGDIAYAPCALFFKERHDVRTKNLEKREPLVQQMQELVSETNWADNTECKNAESSIRKIDTAWKKIKDVEPGPGTKQWKRLRKARTNVYAKLDVVYASNLELKEELIDKAKKILVAEADDNSFKKLQSIQSEWKKIGITKRKDDQKAWNEFKQTTDSIYEQIQNARKAKRAEENLELKPYRDIIKAIQLLNKNTRDLADADSKFNVLQSEHDALPPMPRSVPEKIVAAVKKDYYRACQEFNRTRERIIKKNKYKALDNLATKARLCSDYEALAIDASQVELDDIKSQIDALEISDNSLRKRFAKRLEKARDTDRASFTQARKLLCIDLEILLDKNSPSEDKSLRMQIQLERMQNGGFGQNKLEKSAQIKKLKLDWYCLPGAEPSSQKKLDERFKSLINE